jgi:hypothetical protein
LPLAKPISKEVILAAMSKTNSVKALARYLGMSYIHVKRYMKLYKDEESGLTLFEKHKNQCGKGIPKFLSNSSKAKIKLDDILEGRIPIEHFTSDKIKRILIKEGYLEECCSNCGFNERRILDYKMPLILSFKDKNKRNYQLDNLHLLCYNCYYLFIGNIFTDKDMKQLEEHIPLRETTDAIDFQLESWQLEQLGKLGLSDEKEEDDESGKEFISRI